VYDGRDAPRSLAGCRGGTRGPLPPRDHGDLVSARCRQRSVRVREPLGEPPGTSRDRGELNLYDLVASYDVIVWKHCFPVSAVHADGASPSIASPERTIANYQLQYEALKARMRQFRDKRFIVWTGAALVEGDTDPASARRAQRFFAWVKDTWDERGDNIYV
jgi:hypothetical protein